MVSFLNYLPRSAGVADRESTRGRQTYRACCENRSQGVLRQRGIRDIQHACAVVGDGVPSPQESSTRCRCARLGMAGMQFRTTARSLSKVDHCQFARVIALAFNGIRPHRRFDRRDIFGIEIKRSGGDIFLERRAFARSRDRNHPRLPRAKPCERELPRRPLRSAMASSLQSACCSSPTSRRRSEECARGSRRW